MIFKTIPEAPNYRSNASYEGKGMEQVYWLTNTFIDLITRDQLLPATINITMIQTAVQGGLGDIVDLVKSHWQDLLLQYVGLLTAVIVGLLTALCLPVVGFFVCCCRCAGKCGAYPQTYYDKKSDSCKRFCTGVILSFFVIGVMFGCACVFLTNQYKHDGLVQFPGKFTDSLDDADLFLRHSQASTKVLLVDNFLELEARVLQDLQDGGSTIKERLAERTGAGAVDSLYTIVSSLGKVKRKLKDMKDDTDALDAKIAQLKDGLVRSQKNLRSVLAECEDSADCRTFLTKFSLADLALTEQFQTTQFRLPDISTALADISQLIEDRLEEKVLAGKRNFDKIEETIRTALGDVRPLVKSELSKFGGDLKGYNTKLQEAIGNIDLRSSWEKERLDSRLQEAAEVADDYLYYLGLAMAGAVLLILLFYVLGLFYGLCGNTPHDMYTGDCCDRRTGANLIALAAYLTFLLACPLLLLTTAHFILGTGLDLVVCNTLEHPAQSDLLVELDREVLRPVVGRVVGRQTGLTTHGLLQSCHNNDTLYNILNLARVYDVENLKQWRQHYKLQSLEEGLVVSSLSDMSLLSREAQQDLTLLARSQLSSLDMRKYSELSEDQIFKIDIRNFVRQLEILKEVVGKKQGLREVASKLSNPADFLENMLKVAEQVKLKLRHLKQTTEIYYDLLQLDTRPLGENILELVETTQEASQSLTRSGPDLLKDLTAEHVNSSLDLVDHFVNLIVVGFHRDIGHCAPLSNSYNATVAALCQQIVQPFNGFWAAVGWCCLLYLPCIVISLCLTSLYRKTEKYPGPVVDAETQPLDGHKRRERRGHRRSYSRSERTSSRALPPIPVEERPHSRYRSSDRDPPRYSSNPNMSQASAPPSSSRERERPPPYYSPQH